MKIKVNTSIGEIQLLILQRLISETDVEKQCRIFIEEICKQKFNDFPEYEIAKAYKYWFESLTYQVEEPPYSFKLNGKTFHSCYLELDKQKYSTPLNMQLAFLIEAANVEHDIEKFKDIDNIAALLYREDWEKPFNQKEYLSNAMTFEKSAAKYSLWGLTKYNELILTLKNTFPILYDEENEDNGKTDGRKMFDLLNAVAGDNPSQFETARSTTIGDCFTWMEQKKIESIKRKLNKR